MREITITIAGRDYLVKPLTIAKSREWREALDAKLNPLASVLKEVGAVEVRNFDGLGAVLGTLKRSLIGSMDDVLSLVCQYAPEIAQDLDRIEREAYDEEIVAAFVKILGLAFPLGILTRSLNVNGLTANTTSKS